MAHRGDRAVRIAPGGRSLACGHRGRIESGAGAGQSGGLAPRLCRQRRCRRGCSGSQGRSGLARALLGSTAENLLHALDCDTLVVRGS
ncbi:MAG: universal stress protein [Burkholderiaceae bacterium]|nr:universal stress protein [Burkholderiaceae bacterium]